VQVAVGIPLGLAAGTWGSQVFAAAMATEWMRLPAYIANATYASSAAIALVSGIASAFLVRRMLARLDLIAVLKSSE
jgi:putative ABC transport system permease protein